MIQSPKFKYSLFFYCLLIVGCSQNQLIHKKSKGSLKTRHLIYSDKKCELLKAKNNKGKSYFLFDPNNYVWGAYSKAGDLIACGTASGGARWNKSLNRPSLTRVGHFSIKRMGNINCISHRYPRPHGGALMPYCMFFLRNYAIHGAPENLVPDHENITHGCIRVTLKAAKWLHDDFLKVGSKVWVLPYKKISKKTIK